MSKEKAKNNQAKPRKEPSVALIVVSGLVLLVLFDMFTPIWGGQIRFYAKWVECGQKPIQADGDIAGYIEYHKPSPVFSLLRSNHMNYFCTERQAELAGLSNSGDFYDYPYLTKEERERRSTH